MDLLMQIFCLLKAVKHLAIQSLLMFWISYDTKVEKQGKQWKEGKQVAEAGEEMWDMLHVHFCT